MGICLSIEELREITGKVRHDAQARALRQLGVTFKLRADGMPLVSRTHFEAVMSGIGRPNRVFEAEPDFSVFQ